MLLRETAAPDVPTCDEAGPKGTEFVNWRGFFGAPGLPEDKLDSVFERFYSARPDGEAFGTHSGLGLSISRKIIEAHDGEIRAGNRPGGGARFVVSLPAGSHMR